MYTFSIYIKGCILNKTSVPQHYIEMCKNWFCNYLIGRKKFGVWLEALTVGIILSLILSFTVFLNLFLIFKNVYSF